MSRRRKLLAAAVVLPILALGAVLVTPSSAMPPATGAWLDAAGLQPRFVAVDGVRVRYVRQGQGRGPAVVLLHGFVSSIYSWKEVLPALSREHDVLAIDLPPFGASEIPATFQPSLYERIVPAVLDDAGVARATVVGNSLGGAVAIMAAVRHPARVDRLVLVDSAGFNFAPERRPWLLRVMGSPLLDPVIGRLPVRRELVTLGLWQVLHDDRYATPERIDEYLAPLLRPGAMAAAHGLLGGRQSMGFPGVVGEVKARTLVIWGVEDTWIPASDAKLFQQHIPAAGTRVVMLPGCGHIPQEECAEAVLAPLLSFLRETP